MATLFVVLRDLDETIRFSDKNLLENTYKTIKITLKDGSPYTTISINGFIQKVNIDFGSSSEFSIPEDSKLAKELLKTYKFNDHQRERYTIGGSENITEKVAVIPSIKLGEIEFKNVHTKINIQSKARIGFSFFKEYQIYVENIKHEFKIKKKNDYNCSLYEDYFNPLHGCDMTGDE